MRHLVANHVHLFDTESVLSFLSIGKLLLGLAIAKALAENMGGKLRLKSEMGQGAEVEVLLQPAQSESVVL